MKRFQLRVHAEGADPIVLPVEAAESHLATYVHVHLSHEVQAATLDVTESSHLSFLGFASER